MAEPKIKSPKVFISYAWTSESYIKRVASFAKSLMDVGIDVLFDKFDTMPGNELNNYMERSISDASVTNVLLLLNDKYKEKADKRLGGVGKETQILSEELYNKVKQTKIIPIIFEKGPNGEIYKPSYIGSTYYIDLADAENYANQFQLLVKSIYGETVYSKPTLGTTPSWVTEQIVIEPKFNLQISELKKQANQQTQEETFTLLLDELKNKIVNYNFDNIINKNDLKYLKRYLDLIVFRDEYLELVKNSSYINLAVNKIARFFENCYNDICKLTTDYKSLLYIMLHELFIYTIAYYLKLEKYDKIAYFLGKSYNIVKFKRQLSSYSVFYSTEHDFIDNDINIRDSKSYLTGVGKCWMENIKNEFCSKEEFVLADIICFNYMLFGEKTDLDIYWFPITYIYGISYMDGNILEEFAIRLKTKEFLNKIYIMFNHKTISSFINQFRDVEIEYKNGEFNHYRYQESFYAAPILCGLVKSEELGKYR